MRLLFFDSINPYTGRIHTLDDANLFFGADGLGYARDSWDENFVPYLIPAHPSSPNYQPTTKMTRQKFFPTRHSDQAVWLENFRLKLALHAALLGLAAPRAADIVADARWLVHLLLAWLESVRTHGKAATSALEQAMTGGGPLALPVHTPPPLGDGVVARPAGALSRIFDFVAEIKEMDTCTDAICIDLGILGGEEAVPDLTQARPNITAIVAAVGVDLGWGWHGLGKHLDQCEIQVDRSDGKGWVVLTFDTTPGYHDSTPFPAALTKWKYRAIYRVNDAPIGQWSAEVSVTVGG